ncbi:TATA box-binding protein-associated factor RNA polymerase I subunit A [Brachyhypopomus gauderio]|uniref:TATA box-binding protein-associated factor RNA polymerase I subunit A n=1 Tax=Brachyhypopomus gauderio TaxID=698409 RepID=UPI004041E975
MMDDIEAEFNIPQLNEESESSEDEGVQRTVKLPSLLHVSPTNDRSRETGFHKSMRLCLKAMRGNMLHHRWAEASQYLPTYCQSLEDSTTQKRAAVSEIIWRIGTEILYHHPNSKLEDFTALYERMKISGVKNYAKISLEHSFHLLLNGHVHEAKQQLSAAASWRYGRQSAAQSPQLKLIHAYCGFLDYLSWCMKRSCEDRPGGAEGDVSNPETHTYFRQASVTLQEILTQPGVWDTFILSYIDMLEFYNDQEEALKVLENYAYSEEYPANPNAHVYLYQFLKRHNAPHNKLIRTLKVLSSLVSSHELMLEYCTLLLNSKLQEDLQEALGVSMNLLDYTSWKSDVSAWKCLVKVLELLTEKHLNQLIEREWEQRKSLWLPLHFKKNYYMEDFKENVDLVQLKIKAVKLLGAKRTTYYRLHTQVSKTLLLQKEKERRASARLCAPRFDH